jgi:hypothetical protein
MTMFPRRMMNTATSATLLSGSDFARFIENIIPNTQKAGSGAKRFGTVTKGDEIEGAIILEVMEYRTSSGTIEVLVYCDDGTIRVLNEGTGAWTTKKSGLSANGNPRYTHFNEKLIIVDGINTPMAYNGSTVSNLAEFVTDFDSVSSLGLATAASQTDTNTITVTVAAGRNDYFVGQNIKVTFATAGEVAAVISAKSGSGTITLDVTGTPFPNPSETITKVQYEVSPPAFSDIYTEHNRLWALSAGETKAEDYRSRQNAMRVYFTDATNNENTWYNEDTQEVGYVNLLNKSRSFDELVRISSIDSYMVFFGRRNIFIYAGDNPLELGEFVWQKTLPVGCINGNLVIKYPADLLFFTRYGARSLRTVFQTEGQEVVPDLGSAVDPTVTEFVQEMLGSDATFRKAKAFFYERDGFYGFSFGASYVLIYSLSEESKGWSYFSGDFANATAFCGTSDGRLFLNDGGQLLAYANGTDGQTAYSDQGENILIKWWTPWLRKKNGRWSNIGYELMMEQVADTTITFVRGSDENDATLTEVSATVALTEDSAYWDEANWDESFWDGVKKRVIVRDKFLKDSFCLIMQNESTVGPISFLGLKPIGR